MPKPEESSQGALGHLEGRLDAFDAGRAAKPGAKGVGAEAGQGYRMLSEMLGGVLGGVGLGWLVDHFAHTGPWGVIVGLLIGAGLSIYATIATASRISARAAAKAGPTASVPDDDEDE
ncbi:MAG: AtpZ/AtpI family protein [Caulobacteraceae bacterium]